MTPYEFLHAVWPDDGFYCLALPFQRPGMDKPAYNHHLFDTIEDAASFAEASKHRTDIFFCVHSHIKKEVWDSKSEKFKTSRKQENMQEAKCFFFDLDVEKGNPQKYDSQTEALNGLEKFCKDTDLSLPLVTSSGNGLHVYWRLEQSLPSLEWKQHAAKLTRLARHFGLRADPARTTDQSSVLRVVGTLNLKDPTKPKLVQALWRGEVTETETFIKHLD